MSQPQQNTINSPSIPESFTSFLLKVNEINSKTSKKLINENFRIFSSQYSLGVKHLPSPFEISLCYQSNFSKQNIYLYIIFIKNNKRKYALEKGWKNAKKTVLFWTLFYYTQLASLQASKLDDLQFQDWQEISQIISFYTPFKCKFVYESLKRSCLQSQNWSIEEDDLLRFLMNSPEYGTNNKYKWTKIAQTLNETLKKQTNLRLAKHCRERFFNHLKPNLRKGDWTVEEDIQLLKYFLVFHQKWSQINAKLSGRNDNIVKNRFYKLMKENKLMSKSRKKFNDENIAELIRRLEGSLQGKQHEIFTLNKGNMDENEEKMQKKIHYEKNELFNKFETNSKANPENLDIFGLKTGNDGYINQNINKINEQCNATHISNNIWNQNSNNFYFLNQNNINQNITNGNIINNGNNINGNNINGNIMNENIINEHLNENIQNYHLFPQNQNNFLQNNSHNEYSFTRKEDNEELSQENKFLCQILKKISKINFYKKKSFKCIATSSFYKGVIPANDWNLTKSKQIF